jgi:tetratricopeptide (TPR) repeat protein
MMTHEGFLLCRSLLLVLFFANDTVTVQTRDLSSSAEIVLAWPQPVPYTSAIDGRELLLQFDRPIDSTQASQLPERLPMWIEGANTGFDTLLIRAARDVSYDVRAEGTSIVIRMQAFAAATGAIPPAEQEQGELRLQILRAQLLLTDGKSGDAARLLEDVRREHPDYIPAISNLGQVEHRIGRWRRAHTLYSRALQLDPRNVDVRRLRSEVLADHAARVRIDADFKNVSGAQSERIVRWSGHAFLVDYLRLGVAVDQNHTSLGGNTFVRRRGELYAQYDSEDGSEFRASAFGTRRGLGGGLRYGRMDSSGRLHFQAEYRRPFWESLEGIAGYGTRDRAEIHRTQRLGRYLDSRVTVAFNRYGLNGEDNVARSAGVDGGLAFAFLRGNPYVATEYSFDLESRRFARPGTLPLVSREVHSGVVTTQFRLSRGLIAEGFGGYSWDRLGGHGPFNGGRLILAGPGRLGFQVWFDRRLNTIATSQVVHRAGGYLYWRFQ